MTILQAIGCFCHLLPELVTWRDETFWYIKVPEFIDKCQKDVPDYTKLKGDTLVHEELNIYSLNGRTDDYREKWLTDLMADFRKLDFVTN